jgi:hypothetical protein
MPFIPKVDHNTILNIKTDFVVDKTKHPEFFIRFATLIGCDNASNLLRVYFMQD